MHREYNHIWPLEQHRFGQTDYKDSTNFPKDLDTLIDQTIDDLISELEGVLGEERDIGDDVSCKSCGGHRQAGECDCEGYNTLHRKIKEALNNLKE